MRAQRRGRHRRSAPVSSGHLIVVSLAVLAAVGVAGTVALVADSGDRVPQDDIPAETWPAAEDRERAARRGDGRPERTKAAPSPAGEVRAVASPSAAGNEHVAAPSTRTDDRVRRSGSDDQPPTRSASDEPTDGPTGDPSDQPSDQPSDEPSEGPSDEASDEPTEGDDDPLLPPLPGDQSGPT